MTSSRRFRPLLAAWGALALAAVAFADTRSDFLNLLDRPRVPLAAEAQAPVALEGEGNLVQIAFSFATEAGQRVPGLIVKSAVTDAAAARRPAVITLHGTGGNKDSDKHFMRDLARAGFVGVSIDGRYHGGRSKAGKGSADYVDALLRAYRTPGQEHPFFFDTAWDVMRLIDYLETRDDIDARRIGCFGISKGGIETYLAAAVDPRIAAAVPCIGVQSFGWAIDHDAWQSRISTVQSAFNTAAKDAGIDKPGAEFVRTFYARVAPGIDGRFDGQAMVPLIAPRPLLSINGDTDDRTPMEGLLLCAEAARTAYRAAGAEEKFVLHLQPRTGHKVLPESFVLAREWFERWLKP